MAPKSNGIKAHLGWGIRLGASTKEQKGGKRCQLVRRNVEIARKQERKDGYYEVIEHL